MGGLTDGYPTEELQAVLCTTVTTSRLKTGFGPDQGPNKEEETMEIVCKGTAHI